MSSMKAKASFTNHSTRKKTIQKLVDSTVPPTERVQISRHKSLCSSNNYASLNGKKKNRWEFQKYFKKQMKEPQTQIFKKKQNMNNCPHYQQQTTINANYQYYFPTTRDRNHKKYTRILTYLPQLTKRTS